MSKLGLGRAKLASSVSSAFGQEPPDKKRKTDDNVTADSAWDDDLDILLTQNMNKLDSLVASTQSDVRSGNDELAANCNDWSHHISVGTMQSVGRCEAAEICSDIGQQTASLTGKRLIGNGSGHSRSADNLNSSPSGSLVQMARKGSFSTEKSCTRNKESDKPRFLTSVQAKGVAGPVTNSANVVENLHTSGTLTTSALSMRLDANANCTKTKLTQISEECEYYKAELTKLQNAQYAKDGQIKILRDKYSQAQAELSLQKQQALKAIEQQTEEKTRREADLERDVERLRSQLKFKEHELTELHGCMKKLERQLHSASITAQSPVATSEASRSPVVSGVSGLMESSHHRTSSSPLKPSLPHSSDSSSRILPDNEFQSVDQKLLKTKLTVPFSKGCVSGPDLLMKLLNESPQSSHNLCGLMKRGSLEQAEAQSQMTSATHRTCSLADGHGLCQLGHIGMNQLITDGAMRSTDGNSVNFGLLSSENVGAVLMLPQLESVLRHAVEDLQRSSTQSSHGVSPTCSSKGSVDSGIELRSFDKTAVALRQLLALVRYSRHVRQAIMSLHCTNDIPSNTDHNVPVLETTTNTVKMEDSSDSSVSPYILRVMSNSKMLDILLELASSIQDRTEQMSISSMCLEILGMLAESCNHSGLERFLPVVKSSWFIGYFAEMSSDESELATHLSLVCNALSLLHAVVRSSEVLRQLCLSASSAASEECLLSAVYAFSSVALPETMNAAQLSCVHGLVIKDLILLLRMELETYKSSGSRQNLFVFRQGLFVLKALAVAADNGKSRTFESHYASVHDDFLLLMSGAVCLFRQRGLCIPEHESCANKKQILADEVAAYKNAVQELDPAVKPLLFCFSSCERFPQLFELAIHCLSVSGNSVDAEQSVSRYTLVNAPQLQNITDGSLSLHVVMATNARS